MKHLKLLSALLAVILILPMLPATTLDVFATDFIVTSDTTSMTDGNTYTVNSNVTVSSRITVSGSATLVLNQGATLTAGNGIEVPEGNNTLTIKGAGTLNATGVKVGTEAHAAIGSGYAYGTINIEGGTINATGCINAAGIGGGSHSGGGGTITISGGTVTANGGLNSAGIGGGSNHDWGVDHYGHCGDITITGGTVVATGNGGGAGIGAGGANALKAGYTGTITINGGNVTATGGDIGYGIGPGVCKNNSSNSGTVCTVVIGAVESLTASSIYNAATASVMNGCVVSDGVNGYTGTLTSAQLDAFAGTALSARDLNSPMQGINVDGVLYNVYSGFIADDGAMGVNNDESYAKLVDGNLATKYCKTNYGAYVEFHDENGFIPRGYILTTGNDTASNPTRNPMNWTLYCKARESDSWKTLGAAILDTVLQSVNTSNFYYKISYAGSTPVDVYQYFKIEFTSYHGTTFQLAEMRLYGENPPTEFVEAYPATCTESGTSRDFYRRLSDGAMCYDRLGTLIIPDAQIVIPATGHSMTYHEAVAATEFETGSVAHYECANCGKYFSDAEGENELTASQLVIPAIGHTPVYHAAVAPTSVSNGTIAYYQCSGCGRYFSDEACTHELTEIDLIDYMTVTYLNGTGGTSTLTNGFTILDASMTSWTAGWYVVTTDVTINGRVATSGTVNLVLMDGATLTVTGGIDVTSGNALNIYAQSAGSGMGALVADASAISSAAGIGGNAAAADGGAVTVCGGSIAATGGSSAAGIGGGNNGYAGAIAVNGGQVTATGSIGIGGGNTDGNGTSSLSLALGNGGSVTASSIEVETFMTTGNHRVDTGAGSFLAELATVQNGGTITAYAGSFITVRFLDSDGTTVIDTKTIVSGTAVPRPSSNPTKPAYSFVYWALNGREFDFTTTLTGDTDLVATYEQIPLLTYVNENGDTVSTWQYKTITSDGGRLTGGVYTVFEDLTIPKSDILIAADTVLVLQNNTTLAVPNGIRVGPAATLKICAQQPSASDTLGKLVSRHGIYYDNTPVNGKMIAIYGGDVYAEQDYQGYAAIGSRSSIPADVLIAGGVVTAVSCNYGSAIGTGRGAGNGSVTITGGTVTAYPIEGCTGMTGIGSGEDGVNCAVNISGGVIDVTGSGPYPAIGAGNSGSCNVTISGGSITLRHSEPRYGYAPSIGNGSADDGSITITGGQINDVDPNSLGIGTELSNGTMQISIGLTNPDDFLYAPDYIGTVTFNTPVMLRDSEIAVPATVSEIAGEVLVPMNAPRKAVTFLDEDGTTVVAARSIHPGNKVTEIDPIDKMPSKFFDGWYLNGAEYDFDTPVTADITLTAHYLVCSFPAGSGTEQDPYRITTPGEWVAVGSAVLAGNAYAGSYFKLMNDLTVTTRIGHYDETNGKPFSGIFDGNGCTLTLDLVSGDEPYCAPFSYVDGGTVKNLITSGSVVTSQYYASGLVGATDGVTIENCKVTASILFADTMVAVYSGGFVGHAKSATVTMTGCVFDGVFDHVSRYAYLTKYGYLIGWADAATPYITDCLIVGTSNDKDLGAPIARGTVGRGSINRALIYLKKSAYENDSDDRGDKAVAVTPASDLAIAFRTPVGNFTTSDLICSSNGMIYNGVLYVEDNTTTDYIVPTYLGAPGHYRFTYSVTNGSVLGQGEEAIRLTLGAVSEGVLSVTAVDCFFVTVDSGITGGSVSANKSESIAGETVTLTVGFGSSFNYDLDTITVTGASGNVALTKIKDGEYTFTMPAEDVTVSATFVTGLTSGSGTHEDPCLVGNIHDWNVFARQVSNGAIDQAVYVRQTADISGVTVMAGGSYEFEGTYDGCGHTLTIDLTASEDVCAPFRYTYNALIMRLHVAGTIRTSKKFAGGIIGENYGSYTSVLACVSSVEIISTVNGDGSHGGIVGYTHDDTLIITACRFDGKLTGTNTTCCGGFVGWAAGKVEIYYSLFAPTGMTVSDTGGAAFARNPEKVTLDNCWYKSAFGETVQGSDGSAKTEAELQTLLDAGYGLWNLVNGKAMPATEQRDISFAYVAVSGEFYTGTPVSTLYTGAEITPVIGVFTIFGDLLTKGTDYTLTVSPSTIREPGTYTITITGIGNRCGSQEVTFVVESTHDSQLQYDETDGYYVNMLEGSGVTMNLDMTHEQSGFSIKVYDHGGKNGDCDDGQNSSLCITAPNGYVFVITGYSSIGNQDYLRFYQNFNYTSLGAGYYSGSRTFWPNEQLVTTGKTLKINFQSYNVSRGYCLTVTVIDPADLKEVIFANGTGSTLVPYRCLPGAALMAPEFMFDLPEGKLFDHWSDGTNSYYQTDFITVYDDMTLTAVYVDAVYVTYVGLICGTPNENVEAIKKNDPIWLRDYDDLFDLEFDYEFAYWSADGGVTQYHEGDQYVVSADVTFTAYFRHSPTIYEDGQGGYYAELPYGNWRYVDLSDRSAGFSLKVYDDGGKDADYSNGADDYLTIYAPTGMLLFVSGTGLTYEKEDYFVFFDGDPSVSNDYVILGKKDYRGSFEIGGILTSENALTVYFTSGNTRSDDGCELTVTLIDPNDCILVNYVCAYNGATYTQERYAIPGEPMTLPIFESLFENDVTLPMEKSFKCWKLGNVEYFEGDEYTVTSAVTFEALIIDSPTITFDGNGLPLNIDNSLTSYTMTVDYDEETVLPPPDMFFDTPNGMAPLGWTANGVRYLAGEQITVTEDIVLTALWIDSDPWMNLYNQLYYAQDGDTLNITLTSDVVAPVGAEPLEVPAGVTVVLDLNGYTIDRAVGEIFAGSDGMVFRVAGSLTVMDSSAAQTGKITGGNTMGNSGDYSYYYYYYYGLNAGGGGVCVLEDGVFMLKSGTICGNKAYFGGGVYVAGKGTFIMDGGTICDNFTYDSGVAYAYYGGGGVYVGCNYYNSDPSYFGSFVMNGGKISGNFADNGGGVMAAGNCEIYGGEISGNTALYLGGGVYGWGVIVLGSGEITGNEAGWWGGGVFDEGYYQPLAVKGDAKVYGNTIRYVDNGREIVKTNNVGLYYYGSSSSIIFIDDELSDACIGISLENSFVSGNLTFTFTFGLFGDSEGAGCFFSDDSNFTVEMDAQSGEMILKEKQGVNLDVNGDSVVNISDVSALLNYLAGSSAYDANYDVDSNGVVNIADVSFLVNALANN